MNAVDGREARLDLRLVPAALTSWAVTVAGILWSTNGVVAVVTIAVGAAAVAGWWGSRSGRCEADGRHRLAPVGGWRSLGSLAPGGKRRGGGGRDAEAGGQK